MIKFVAVVFGSYLLSVALVLVTDPLLSRIFPGDLVRGRVPSYEALLASTALLWSSPSFLLGSVPASHLAAQTDMCSGSLSLGK
jgi:hypothetical protein